MSSEFHLRNMILQRRWLVIMWFKKDHICLDRSKSGTQFEGYSISILLAIDHPFHSVRQISLSFLIRMIKTIGPGRFSRSRNFRFKKIEQNRKWIWWRMKFMPRILSVVNVWWVTEVLCEFEYVYNVNTYDWKLHIKLSWILKIRWKLNLQQSKFFFRHLYPFQTLVTLLYSSKNPPKLLVR